MNLIINADDFGLTKGVNLGILEGMIKGIITSTTMIANGDDEAFLQAVELYQQYNPDVGVHLVLTMGAPLSAKVPSLTDENGNFYQLDQMEKQCLNMKPYEIKKKFMAQINKIQSVGIEITHLDSHHHVHMLPVIKDVYLELAKKLKIPVRGFLEASKEHSNPHLITAFYGSELSEDGLCHMLLQLSEDYTEIMCHPAYVDQELIIQSRYHMMRAKELSIFCSNAVKEIIQKRGINLIGYREFGSVREEFVE